MDEQQDIGIGKIVGSNSHIDYICEIYSEDMRENPPGPTDYEFGQFVYIKKQIEGEKCCFIGVIYDTQIVDPDQGRTGPRLSQPEEQNIFQPTYVDEKQILAGIALLGYLKVKEGEIVKISHDIPNWTLEVDDVVKKLSKENMVSFHEIENTVRLEYFQRIIDVADGFAMDLISNILEELKQKKPGEADVLEVIQQNLEWQTKIREV